MPYDLKIYLLLDYLTDGIPSFKQLASKDADEAFNMPHHQLSTEQLNIKLKDMRALGLIKITPSKLNEDKSIPWDARVSLTAKGGMEWEKWFNPDWQKYIMDEAEIKEFGLEKTRLESLNLDELLEIIKIVSVLECPFSIKVLRPWKSHYWKQFEKGFRLEFTAAYDALPEAYFKKIYREWYERNYSI
jgi:hypothetical protein